MSTSTNSQIGTSFTPSRDDPVESYSENNHNVFIVQSSPILCPCFSHIFECNLYLKHHFGEENSLPNNLTKKNKITSNI